MTVPNVLGITLAEAVRELQALGLGVVKHRRPTDVVEPGHVFEQDPSAEAEVESGSSVELTVAVLDATPAGLKCPSSPLRGVYHAYRLHVLATCRWFVGTVVAVRSEDDGDHHVDIAPDHGYAKYLNGADSQRQHGGLLIEIMPGQHLPLPVVGEHVSVFGTWVYDSDHGWNEFHPVWAIKYLDSGRTVYALPPITPRYHPASSSTGSTGGTSGGSNCDPAYPTVCLHDGIGDYDCAGGSGNGPNYVTGPIKVLAPDPFGLDSNHDGIGCE